MPSKELADGPEQMAAWHGISPLQQLREIAGPTGRRVVLNERPHGGHAAVEGELWPVWLDFLIAELMDSDS